MIVIIGAALCIVYDVLYMLHSIKGRRTGAVIGMAVLIALIAAGTAALRLGHAG